MPKSIPSPGSHKALRVALYLRVSDPGATDKFGMDAQRAECLAYAERMGWVVVAIFEDWQTGTELFERTEMTRCREAMRRGEFDVLLVDRLNRLSRKAHHQGYIRTEAEAAGVAVASATEDLSNPILVGVYGGMAEATRDEAVRNMKRGKRQKVANGLPLGSGQPPFGLIWRTERQELANGTVVVRKVGYDEDPATIFHLARCFGEFADGASLRQLAVALEADGVAPPYAARTGSMRWHATTIARILADRIYLGEAIAYRTESVRKKRTDGPSTRLMRDRPEEDWVRLPDGTAPVVIEPALFARVQHRLERNKTECCRRDRDPQVGILRRGYAVCGECGHPLTVVTPHDPTRQPYYRCNATRRRWACAGSGAMAVAALDDAIWSWLTIELADEDRVRWHLDQMQRDDAGADDLATIERQLAQIGRQQTSLAQAVATMGDNPDGVAPLLAQLDALGKQRRAAEQDRADITARLAQAAAVAAQVRDLQDRCREIAELMATVTDYPDRRQMVALLGVKVTLSPAAQRPRWTATSIITPDGITSDKVCHASRHTSASRNTRRRRDETRDVSDTARDRRRRRTACSGIRG
jgi:DNA invertase Pin-like site-specific DNA recombinase